MELSPLSVRSLTPLPEPEDLIPLLPSEEQVFCKETRITDRTFYIVLNVADTLIFSECKRELNKSNRLANQIRRFFRVNPLWVSCNILVAGERTLQVYIKQTNQFNPLPERIYHLEPPITLEGSGRTAFLPSFVQSGYRIFQRMNKPTAENRYEVEKKITSSGCSLLAWSANVFVIDTYKELGQGATKLSTVAYRVEAFSAYHFRVSQRALLRAISGYENMVDFMLPKLDGLNHPNIGIPEKENLRYRMDSNSQGPIRKWYHLTYLGKDLYKAAPNIPNEKALCRTLLEMLAGVKYLCENGRIHEDLKPSNWILYSNDETSSVVRLEDCQAIRSIESGPRNKMPMQTLLYLPLHLRKPVLDRIEPHKTILNIRNSTFLRLWQRAPYQYPDSFSAMRNTLGLSMAEVWYNYRIKHSISEQNRLLIESTIEKLAIYPLRHQKGTRYYNFSSYLQAGDLSLRASRNTAEQIFTMVENCPPLEEIEASLLQAYRNAL